MRILAAFLLIANGNKVGDIIPMFSLEKAFILILLLLPKRQQEWFFRVISYILFKNQKFFR